jgi:hypothetical protein
VGCEGSQFADRRGGMMLARLNNVPNPCCNSTRSTSRSSGISLRKVDFFKKNGLKIEVYAEL